MKQYTRFSGQASLAVVGVHMNQMGLWQAVEQQVHIKQKVLRHRPIDKLKDAFINILAGGHGLVETNLRVRSDGPCNVPSGAAPVRNNPPSVKR